MIACVGLSVKLEVRIGGYLNVLTVIPTISRGVETSGWQTAVASGNASGLSVDLGLHLGKRNP